jgi:predicted  nucleic acid-binding Zn-ribbon protein
LENENNTLMKGMKTSVEGSKMLDQAELSQKVADKESEIQNLTQMVVSLEEKLKQGEPRPKSNISKDLHTSQLENQLQEMNHYCAEIEQKLSMKEYEINGLKDKNGYLEEQLHIKSEEVANNGRLLQEKLQRIETELASKSSQNIPLPAPVQYARIEEDY